MNLRILAYYLKLGWTGLGRNRLLTALMVLAIGLGIGSFMTIYNLYYMMSGDPIAHKSDQLFNVRLDVASATSTGGDYVNDVVPGLMTYRDSKALLEAGRGLRQIAHFYANFIVDPGRPDVRAFAENTRVTGGDFFAMFDVPFIHGSGWTEAQEQNAERVAVINREMNERLFGGENSIGETIKLNGEAFTVVGVTENWHPLPRFYDLVVNPLGRAEGIYIPFSLTEPLQIQNSGNTNCWDSFEPGFEGFIQSGCVWTGFWVELPDRQAREDYRTFIEAYIADGQTRGYFPRSSDYRLENVREWARTVNVAGGETPIMLVVSFLFLIVCLINTVGLLLAKFLSRSGELGVRRALGADRVDIFAQHLAETGLLGVAGGLLGLGMTWLGLRALEAMRSNVSRLVEMQWEVVLLTVLAAIVAAMLTGLYPAWRATRIVPAAQIRTQ